MKRCEYGFTLCTPHYTSQILTTAFLIEFGYFGCEELVQVYIQDVSLEAKLMAGEDTRKISLSALQV